MGLDLQHSRAVPASRRCSSSEGFSQEGSETSVLPPLGGSWTSPSLQPASGLCRPCPLGGMAVPESSQPGWELQCSSGKLCGPRGWGRPERWARPKSHAGCVAPRSRSSDPAASWWRQPVTAGAPGQRHGAVCVPGVQPHTAPCRRPSAVCSIGGAGAEGPCPDLFLLHC